MRYGVKPEALPHILDLAGLGALAVPVGYHMAHGESTTDKAMSGVELGGLGLLAAPALMHLTGH
jgi:hypothetical protein